MSASDVQAALAARDVQATVNAIRNHLNRLVQSGDLERDEDKNYSPDVATDLAATDLAAWRDATDGRELA